MAANARYKAEYIEQARKFRLLGATLKQTAEFFDITVERLETWRNKHKAFNEALREGSIIADAKVAESLYKRACGFTHPEDKVFHFQGEVVVQTVTKHYPPDTEAAKFWLRVRQREMWGEAAEKGKDTTVNPLVIKRAKRA